MRSQLKEAIRRIHSEDYHKLISTSRELRQARGLLPLRGMMKERILPKGPVSRALVISLIAGAIFLPLAVIIGGGVYYFNRYSLLIVELEKQKSLVENESRRRADLLPNLLVISAEYSAHEKLLYKYVSEMRNQLTSLKGEAPQEESPRPLNKILSNLLAIAEEYPDLKATQSFEQLMGQWTQTEDRLAECRAQYIETVKEYNGLYTTFPSNLYGYLFGRRKRSIEPSLFEDLAWSQTDLKAFYPKYLELRAARTGVNESPLFGKDEWEATAEGSALQSIAESTAEERPEEDKARPLAGEAVPESKDTGNENEG